MFEATTLSLTDVFEARSDFKPRRISSSAPVQRPEAEDRYSVGLADGQMLAETAFAVERQRLLNLITSADALQAEDNAEIGFLLDNSIRQIVRNIIGEISLDPSFLEQQILAATALLTEADKGRHICLNADDLALLSGIRLPLPCKADPNLPVGSIRIECSEGWIEHGPAFALQRLDDALRSAGDAP